MRRFVWTGLAVAGILFTPGLSAAVVGNFPVTPIGTDAVPTGTIKLTSESGQEIVVQPGEKKDLPPGTYKVDSRFTGFWGHQGTCVIPSSGGTCEVPANPVRPYQVQTPPWGGFLFAPFFETVYNSNLPLASFRQKDVVGGGGAGIFTNQFSRQQIGERNAQTDNQMTTIFGGMEIAVGLPQYNRNSLQINSAVQLLLGGADISVDTHSHSDNRALNRKVSADGVGFGIGGEVVAASTVLPIGARVGGSVAGGSVDGSLNHPSATDDGGALSAATSKADVEGSWTRYTARFDVLFPFWRKVSPYGGITYRYTDTSLETTLTGNASGTPAQRFNKYRFIGDQLIPHVGAEFSLFSMDDWPPLGGRFEVGYGPCGCYEAFFKIGVMLGGNGSWTPARLIAP